MLKAICLQASCANLFQCWSLPTILPCSAGICKAGHCLWETCSLGCKSWKNILCFAMLFCCMTVAVSVPRRRINVKCYLTISPNTITSVIVALQIYAYAKIYRHMHTMTRETKIPIYLSSQFFHISRNFLSQEKVCHITSKHCCQER